MVGHNSFPREVIFGPINRETLLACLMGIPQDQQDQIFKKLFRADNVLIESTDGTGLGLYLIKSILDEVGGRISFVSEENKGTTFTVTLALTGMKKKDGSRGLE